MEACNRRLGEAIVVKQKLAKVAIVVFKGRAYKFPHKLVSLRLSVDQRVGLNARRKTAAETTKLA